MENSIEKELNWHYKMIVSDTIKYSCIIQSENGDNICKMLRDEAPSNKVQEEYAKVICTAPQMAQELIILHGELKLQTEMNRLRGEGKDWSERITAIEAILEKIK